MAVILKAFRSDTGFESPGFYVDTAGNVDFSGALKLNGVTAITATALSSSIKFSSLTTLGTLSGLNVAGNITVNSGSIDVDTDGIISIRSTVTGSIDNVAIGTVEPTTGRFTEVSVIDKITIGGEDILTANPITTRTLDNYTIGSTNPQAATFTTLSATTNVNLNPSTTGNINNTQIGLTTAAVGRFTDVNIVNEPSSVTHATTKNYVDSRVTAYAIALGS